jgi:hypothetical protein
MTASFLVFKHTRELNRRRPFMGLPFALGDTAAESEELRQTKPISAGETAAIGDCRLRIGDSTTELAETPKPETANKANVFQPEREMANKANLVTTRAHHGDTEITEKEVNGPIEMT